MFVYGLKVSIFAFAAFVMAYIVGGRFFRLNFVLKALILWGTMVPVLFILQHQLFTFVVFSALLLILRRTLSINETICFFIIAIAAVPAWFKYIPAGFYTLTYWKILVVCILIPLVPRLLNNRMPFNAADIFVILFFLYTSAILLSRGDVLSVTVAARKILDNGLYYVVPYFVISRSIGKDPREYLSYCNLGFIILGFLLAGIFLFNQLAGMDLYNVFRPGGSIYGGGGATYRGMFLRTEGPLSAEGLGLVVAGGFLSVLLLKQYIKVTSFQLVLMFSMLILAVISTGSRGALFTLILSILFYFFCNSSFIIKFVLSAIAIFAVLVYLNFESTAPVYEDEYGTFEFREQLFEASFEFMATKPVFGDLNYINSGFFDHMRRGGSGFIDIVSIYLTVMLPFGYLGLFFYLFPYIFVLFRSAMFLFSSGSDQYGLRPYMAIYVPLILGYLFLISTVSDVGLIAFIGTIILAISRSALFYASSRSY